MNLIYIDNINGNPTSLISTESPDTYLRVFFTEDAGI